MSISISQRSTNALSTLNSVPKDKLENICKYILQVVVVGRSALEIGDEADQLPVAVATLFVEAARAQASTDQFRAFLDDLTVSADRVKVLADLYEQNKGPLVSHLETIGISAPQLVGVDWRLDYAIRSKHGGRGNTPVFFVNLKLKERGIVRDVELIASQEELLDMLAKVRDAVKQTDRILTATSSDSS